MSWPASPLSSLTDVYGRQINFSYEGLSGVNCLRSVSQISMGSTASIAAQYGYQLLGSPTPRPHLTLVSVPSPTGSGMSTESFSYNSDLQVSGMTDPKGNTHTFTYKSPDATKVEVKDPEGVLKQRLLQIFDPENHNVAIGRSDDSGSNVALECGDPNGLMRLPG